MAGNTRGRKSCQSGQSGQSKYPSSLGETSIAILKALTASPIPKTPKETSQETGIRLNIVQKQMRRLERKGYTKREFYGHYVAFKSDVSLSDSIAEGGGVGFALAVPRVHCLRYHVRDMAFVARPRDPWEWRSKVLRVKFFRHRKAAQVFCDCVGDLSLDYVGFRFLTEAVLRELGCSDWRKVSLIGAEFNKDLIGWRLDGAKAVTLRAFDGSFRRIYQKRVGLRDEVKLAGSLPVEKALLLMGGGVSSYNLFQFLFLSLKEAEAQRMISEAQNAAVLDGVGEMRRLNNALINHRVPVAEKTLHAASQQPWPFDDGLIKEDPVKLTPPQTGWCVRCHWHKVLTHLVEQGDHWGFVCRTCAEILSGKLKE